MIEIKHLKTLLTLSDTGSLVATAKALYLTQSALSHQIKDLESRLECQLFERKTQPVRFTTQGKLLLELAKNVLPQCELTQNRIRDSLSAPLGNLRMYAEHSSCYHWLLPAITAFNKAWPDTQVECLHEQIEQPTQQLLEADLDLLITSEQKHSERLVAERLVYEHISDFKLKLIVAPSHPLAQKAYVTALDLKDETIICTHTPKEEQALFKHFIQNARFDGALLPVNQAMLVFDYVAANMGVAAMPEWLVAPFENQGRVTSLHLGALGLRRPLYLAMKKPLCGKPIIDALLKACKNALR